MKRVLITGENGYISKATKKWLEIEDSRFYVETISLRNEGWKYKDFSLYDSIIHTVGIAHVDSNPAPDMEKEYYRVNRDLTNEVAVKAKKDNVEQFIFLSSIIIYGESNPIDKELVINKKTEPNPSSFYGNSKLEAEELLDSLRSESFKVAIVRLPMVYGKGAKGNYEKLAKISKAIIIFPSINNQRSMIHIDNLTEFLRLIIINKDEGLFFPQNKEYVSTSEMVKAIATVHKRKMILTGIFNPLLIYFSNKIGIIKKVFGNIVYDKSLSVYKEDYWITDFRESIKRTERG